MSGSSLYMYGEEKQKEQQAKLPLPAIKWERHNIHDKRAVLTISGATATYGTADGSAVIASCSEGTNEFSIQFIFLIWAACCQTIFDQNGRDNYSTLCHTRSYAKLAAQSLVLDLWL